ncbi:MAG: DegT/DnrJ/EryC1/StrS family aminotransferase [Victivallaceae bacterium]|nr:DegT/DnrJ/EryC1/StrS family aminotransferase [Victivallaceae bacterium]
MQVPLLDLRAQYASFKDEVLPVIAEICDAQQFILGAKVEAFEKELADYCRCRRTIGVTSGSDALLVALMAENIGPGDEVVTTPFTFFATVGAIVRVGATPVFADIDPVTFNIDPAAVESKITPKTRAIIPVHLFGQSADMDPIMKIAEKHHLVVIEDACQAIGAEYRGRRVGSIGDYGAFSFFPSKNLGCFGDGGAVSCNDEAKADKIKIFRNHGQSKTYYHEYVGGNFRLDALQAAVLSIKLRRLDAWSEARRSNAADYEKLFAAAGLLDGRITLPARAAYPVRHIYNQYCIRVADGRRDALRDYLHAHGVGCAIYYPLSLHLQPCFAALGGKKGDCPQSEKATAEVLALPVYGECSAEQRRFVVETIAAFYRGE